MTAKVIQFHNNPVAVRRRLNELQRVLDVRAQTVEELLIEIHEETTQGSVVQEQYNELLQEYIRLVGVDKVQIKDLEFASDVEID